MRITRSTRGVKTTNNQQNHFSIARNPSLYIIVGTCWKVQRHTIRRTPHPSQQPSCEMYPTKDPPANQAAPRRVEDLYFPAVQIHFNPMDPDLKLPIRLKPGSIMICLWRRRRIYPFWDVPGISIVIIDLTPALFPESRKILIRLDCLNLEPWIM